MVGRCELDERVRVRGEEGERGADADEDEPRQACLVHRGEREQEDAEPERPGRERPERRALERRRGDRAGERPEPERGREEPERARVDVQRVRGEERHERVEVEADEPDARHDDEHGAHLRGRATRTASPSRVPARSVTVRSRATGIELVLAHREQGREDGEEAERVDEEADADAGGGDQDPGDRRADDAGRVERGPS